MSKITKENLFKVFGLGLGASRIKIAKALGISDSEARLYWGIVNNYDVLSDIVNNADEEDKTIIEQNVRLAKQKQKFQDVNRIERKSFREYARVENAISELTRELRDIFDNNPYFYKGISHDVNNKAVGVIQISDVHFNELIDLKSNKYDFTIASQRLYKLVVKAKQYFKLHNITDVFVFFTGDLMNSDRRLDEILAMASNRSKAAFISVQILENVLVDLNQDFNIHVAGICGNESRINKDFNWNGELVSDNYDFTIFNILRYKLSSTEGINFLGLSDKTEQVVEVNGKNFLLIHGHQFGKDITKDLSKLARKYSQMGIDIHFIIWGHLHEALMSDTYARSSSVCGSNNYSEDALLLMGKASQNIYIVFDNNEIDSIKVDLQDVDGYLGYDTHNWKDAYNPRSLDKVRKVETILKITI